MQISPEEQERRRSILEDNPWKVIVSICAPLVMYTSLSQVFQFIDTLIAANMSAGVVSTVAFIQQIQTMLTAIGSGLSLGGGIIIARNYGAGDMEEVCRQISTLFFIALFICGGILAVVIPFAYPFLKLLRMPDDLIGEGTAFFVVEICGLVCLFINSIFLSIQKARGDTKMILWYNLMIFTVKTGLNIFFVYGMKFGMLCLPAATLIGQGTLTAVALVQLNSPRNPFRISLRHCQFKKKFLVPLASLSLPVFLEKFVFAFGKVIVNSMCAHWGSSVVGALGVSNRLGGLSTNPMNGVQEGETALISQNLGNRNLNRALGIFYRVFVLNLGIALVFFILTGIFKAPLVNLFAKSDANFAIEIDKIYTYERLDNILIAMNASVMGLLYGFGKTRISMVLNLIRLFGYRIPSLYLMMNLEVFAPLGISAVGIAMLISNGLVGITASAVAIVLIRRIRKKGAGDLRLAG